MMFLNLILLVIVLVIPTLQKKNSEMDFKKGPPGMLWQYNICPELSRHSGSLKVCKKLCLETDTCTAFNFLRGYSKRCELLRCPVPVPEPTWNYGNGWIGYSRTPDVPICSPPCVNGACAASNTCKCNPGWEGPQCQDDSKMDFATGPPGMLWHYNICPELGKHSGSLEVCKATCLQIDTCTAFNFVPGRSNRCELLRCPVPVAEPTWNYGKGWIGYSLIPVVPVCSPPCVNGACTASNTCKCNPGWEGPQCQDDSEMDFVTGPPGMLWHYNICPELGRQSGSLEICKNACLETDTCTAFNFLPGRSNRCELLRCPIPVPEPTWNYGRGWIGYSHTQAVPVCSLPCLNGACTASNTCKCNPGWEGPQCQDAMPACSPPCVNGACTASNTCKCNPGWEGSQCQDAVPVCSPSCVNGACTASNTCKCNKGWEGPQCQDAVPVCSPPCVNGACMASNTCKCNEGWEGPQCQDKACSAICSELSLENCKSKTIREQCKDLCSAESCSETCLHGSCSPTFTCECKSGYGGPNCDRVRTDGSDCRYPWLYINTNLTRTCISLFSTMTPKNTWENARKKCQEMGGDLPKFTSRNQIDGLFQYFKTERTSIFNRKYFGYWEHWIRGYRMSDGKSYWADDGTEIPSDLFSKALYFERVFANRPYDWTKGPTPTSIDKECLMFSPQPKNSDPAEVGIYNHGNIPCDKQVRGNSNTGIMCQKYVE